MQIYKTVIRSNICINNFGGPFSNIGTLIDNVGNQAKYVFICNRAIFA